MSVSSLTTGSQSSALGLINGTGDTTTTSVNSVVSQSQGTDSAQFSKGGQLMSKLASLQSSDPTKFKEAAQKISDSLAEDASKSTNAEDAKHLKEMSEKFAESAKTGSMPSFQHPNQSATSQAGGEASGAVSKFQASGDHKAFFSTVDNAVESALSAVGSTSA